MTFSSGEYFFIGSTLRSNVLYILVITFQVDNIENRVFDLRAVNESSL